MFGHPTTLSMSHVSKRLVPCGFALAMVAGLYAAPAGATSLSDYYRTMFTMKFCNTGTADSEEVSETDVEEDIRLPVDQEFIDAGATSEDVAPIFEQLNAEYNANPESFCEQNTAAAQEVIEQTP
jgi:hypothetical protein